MSSDILNDLTQLDGVVGVLGSMNADYTVSTERLPKPGETVPGGSLEILPGGKSGNQAAAAAKLGVQVRMFGAVGQDRNGGFLKRCLSEAGVDVSAITEVPGPSGTTMITVDAKGENTIVYSAGANATLDLEWLSAIEKQLAEVPVLGLCLETPMEVVEEAARITHEAGGTVVLNDSPFIAKLPKKLIENADVLIVNEHEAGQLLNMTVTDQADWDRVAWAMEAFGFSRSIITLGAKGSVVLDGKDVTTIPSFKVKVRDTTGCGDSFMGTILAALASGKTLVEAAQMASYVSSFAAARTGAQASYGTAVQVRAAFSEA